MIPLFPLLGFVVSPLVFVAMGDVRRLLAVWQGVNYLVGSLDQAFYLRDLRSERLRLLARHCHSIVSLSRINHILIFGGSTLGGLSLFLPILLACHEETVSSVEIAFVYALLAHKLWSLHLFISVHSSDHRGSNTVRVLSIVLEFESHILVVVFGSTSIHCITGII